jgi:hypothetical protein
MLAWLAAVSQHRSIPAIGSFQSAAQFGHSGKRPVVVDCLGEANNFERSP